MNVVFHMLTATKRCFSFFFFFVQVWIYCCEGSSKGEHYFFFKILNGNLKSSYQIKAKKILADCS